MLIYLGQKYTNVEEEAYKLAPKLSAQILKAGHDVFSPILAFHPLAAYADKPHSWWMLRCIEMLKKCDAAVFVYTEGWHESKGMAEEMEYCKQNNIPFTTCTEMSLHEAIRQLENE